MTSRDLVLSVESGDAHRFTSMSEGYVYLYLRFHADRRGIFRLSMTELAATLDVNRQTILKHIETLTAKRMVTRQGHGRYQVFAEPWSLQRIAKEYFDSLPIGAEFNLEEMERRAYGESNDLDWDRPDPRVDALCATWDTLEAGGFLKRNADSALVKARAMTAT